MPESLIFFKKERDAQQLQNKRMAYFEENNIVPCNDTSNGHEESDEQDTQIYPVYKTEYINEAEEFRTKPTFKLCKIGGTSVSDGDLTPPDEVALTRLFFSAKYTENAEAKVLQRIPGKDGFDFMTQTIIKVEDNDNKMLMLTQIGLSLLYNLKDIHEQGILHRDVKPENIIVYPFYNPKTHQIEYAAKFIDFGLSCKKSDVKSEEQVGTKEYASPESWSETQKHDYYSDIYSLGVVLGELYQADEHPIKLEQLGTHFFEIDINEFKNIDESKLNDTKKRGLDFLKVLFGEMCSISPDNRPNIDKCIEEYTKGYKNITNKQYKPFHKIKTNQTKLDKLLENITILTGLQAEPLFQSDDWEKLFDVIKYQINDYASEEKIDRVVIDEDPELRNHKKELLRAINKFIQKNLSEKNIAEKSGAAHLKNLKVMCRLIYGIQQCTSIESLDKKVARVMKNADALLQKAFQAKLDNHQPPSPTTQQTCKF